MFHLELSRCDYKLGFTDISVASAHKALLLVEAGLGIAAENTLPKALRKDVRSGVKTRIGRALKVITDDELAYLHIIIYRQLLKGLIGCGALWDGLMLGKKALLLFPDDVELQDLKSHLEELFKDRHNDLKESGVTADLVALSRTGKIFQKPYPWTDKELYSRSPELLEHINGALRCNPCRVKRTVFTQDIDGSNVDGGALLNKDQKDQGDGPLGLFATRDIKEGEIILEDSTIIGISNIPSSTLQHCDACHASLLAPFIRPSEIIQANCCKMAAYCSRRCHNTAMAKYHRILCGKDWSWLYSAAGGTNNSNGPDDKWRPIMFLRIMAIVLNDTNAQYEKTGRRQHPLQHNLLARMAANYPSPDKLVPEVDYDWQYFENIVAPTRILLSLGIDIFTDTQLTPEVVQTIYWRLENNANMSTISLPLSQLHGRSISTIRSGKTRQDQILSVNAVNLNPNYLFFNHSCEPNVSWHGVPPDPFVEIGWPKGTGNKIIRPGSSTVICIAANDIKKGEELKISYIGDPRGESDKLGRLGWRHWLKKWFEDGCGCALCEKERKEEGNGESDKELESE